MVYCASMKGKCDGMIPDIKRSLLKAHKTDLNMDFRDHNEDLATDW